MFKTRSRAGATLALVVVSCIIIIIVGVAAFFLFNLIGGQHELQNATDAGDLNVAKQAILRPNTTLNAGVEDSNFRLLLDNVPGSGRVVDLKVYNRLVGQAILVAMNATTEGTVGPNGAIPNAKKLVDALQATGGIGDRLAKQLENQGRTIGFFQDLNLSNNTRLVDGKQDAANNSQRGDVQFAAAWMEQRNGDRATSNVFAPITVEIPAGYPGGAPQFPAPGGGAPPHDGQTNGTESNSGGKIYVRGYKPIDFGRSIGKLVAVPTQPGKQPHLVSAVDFNVQQSQPVAGAIVPPNSFQTGCTQQGRITPARLNGLSRALIGVLDQQYLPSIHGGYLQVINGSGLPSVGTLFNGNTVLNTSRMTTGIAMSGSGHFSSNHAAMAAWEQHNNAPPQRNGQPFHQTTINGHTYTNIDGPGVPNPNNVNTAIYNSAGNPVRTPQQAHQIRGAHADCTDMNTYIGPGGDTQCGQELPSMEKAYTPGFNGYQQPAPPGNNLTALEQTKCDVMHQFNSCGTLTANASSGQEFYVNGCLTNNCPYPQNHSHVTPNKRCSISDPGTMQQLLTQSNASLPYVTGFLRQRLAQMDPERANITGAGGSHPLLDADVNTCLNALVPMGQTQFIYYTFAANGNPNNDVLTINTNNPPGRIAGQTPDGLTHNFTAPYPQPQSYGGGFAISPPRESQIHDQLYKCPGGGFTVNENAQVQPSSGFNNLLGQFTFGETINGATYYCCPD